MHTKKAVAFWAQVLCKHVFTDGDTLSADDVERIKIACHQIIKELGQVTTDHYSAVERGLTVFYLSEREGGFDIIQDGAMFCGRAVKRADTWIISLKGNAKTIRSLVESGVILSLEGIAKD